MKTVEHVKLKSDSNYVHVKWAVMEVSVGGTLGASNAWIKCISYGCDTKENLLAFKLTSDGYKPVLDSNGHPQKQDVYTSVDKSGLVGTLGEYQVVSLSDIEPYNRGGKIDFTPNIPLG
jgi:hypothetical protein